MRYRLYVGDNIIILFSHKNVSYFVGQDVYIYIFGFLPHCLAAGLFEVGFHSRLFPIDFLQIGTGSTIATSSRQGLGYSKHE